MHVKQRIVNDKSNEQLRRECTDVNIYFVYAANCSFTFNHFWYFIVIGPNTKLSA